MLAGQPEEARIFRPPPENTTRNESITPKVSKYHTPGHLGQVDIWGPYHIGRSGHTHIFTLIDSFSQYAISLPCTIKSGELPKLLSQAIGIFLSLGVKFEMIVGDQLSTRLLVNTYFTRHMEIPKSSLA